MTEKFWPICKRIHSQWGFPGGSGGKESAAMQEPWVQSVGREDPLEKGTATQFSVLAWRILWTEEPGRLQSMGPQRVGHNWATSLSLSWLFISDTYTILTWSEVKWLSRARLFVTPWTVACTKLLHPWDFLGKKEYWSGLPFQEVGLIEF